VIQVKTTVKFKAPDLDFTETLKEIADKIILPDIRLGINTSVGFDQKPFPELEASTKAAKADARSKARKAGGLLKAGLSGGRAGGQTLVDTGELRDRSMFSEKVAKNHVRIGIADGRNKIAYYLQEEGVGKKKKKFNFFGISQRAEFQAIAKMGQAIKNSLVRIN